MQIGLFGDLGAQRIDDGEPAAAALAFRMPRTRCTLETVALLPQTRLSLACSAKSGGQPGTAP